MAYPRHPRKPVLLRLLMLLLTVTLLFFGVISFYQITTQVAPLNPFLAVEGDGFVHVTYKNPEIVPEQSGLRYYFPSVLTNERLQVLLQVFGSLRKPDGETIQVTWTIQDYFNDFKRINISISRGQQLIHKWQEEFVNYDELFDRVVEIVGVDGTIQINYLPRQETDEAGTQGRTLNQVVEAMPVPAPPATYVQIGAAMMFLVVGFFVYFSTATKSSIVSEVLYSTCIAFFGLLSLNSSNPDGPMQWIIFWLFIVSLLSAPAMLLKFSLTLRSELCKKSVIKHNVAILAVPLLLLLSNIVAVATYILMEPVSPLGYKTPLFSSTPFSIVFIFNSLFVIASILLSMWILYRTSDSKIPLEAMQQLRWVFWGIALGLLPYATVTLLLNPATNQNSGVLNLAVSLPLLLAPASFGLAVLSRRFIDVDVIFKRGFIYFSSSFLLFIVYIGLMYGLRAMASDITTETIVVISGGMILLATLFSHRVKDYVQSFFDRFLHRDFFNFRRTLQRFSMELNYERNLETLLDRISNHIEKHFSISPIVIFIASARRENFVCAHSTNDSFGVNYINTMDSQRIKQVMQRGNPLFIERLPDLAVVETLKNSEILTVIPFLSLGEVIGFLCLGNTKNGDPLNTDDLELLTSLTDRAGASIDNALLYMDIETRAEAMRILKEYNENILESVDSGICVVDAKGIVQSWNSALENAFIISRDNAIGTSILTLMPSRLANVIDPYLFGGSETGRFHTLYKIRVQNNAGDLKVFNISFSPLGEFEHNLKKDLHDYVDGMLPSGENSEGTVLIFDDVTEGVNMEEKLQQQDKLAGLGLMAAGVAHEVNTPLAGIAGYVQMLQKKMADFPEQNKILDKIDKQVFRASKIINNLLNFSRQGDTVSERIGVNTLVNDTLLLVENQLKGRNIKLVQQLSEDVSPVRGDKTKLQQVLLNLILNARDSIENSGTITLSTFNAGANTIKCIVEDSGIGIEKEAIAKIFDPFFTTKKMGEGTGLGLSVSYGIIQEHNGDITVESERGKGTKFIITLPSDQSQESKSQSR